MRTKTHWAVAGLTAAAFALGANTSGDSRTDTSSRAPLAQPFRYRELLVDFTRGSPLIELSDRSGRIARERGWDDFLDELRKRKDWREFRQSLDKPLNLDNKRTNPLLVTCDYLGWNGWRLVGVENGSIDVQIVNNPPNTVLPQSRFYFVR